MSTLEKTIDLLETLPDDKIEAIYAFARFIDSDVYVMPSQTVPTKIEDVQSVLGIAHEYANPALIEQEEGAFERAADVFTFDKKVNKFLTQE